LNKLIADVTLHLTFSKDKEKSIASTLEQENSRLRRELQQAQETIESIKSEYAKKESSLLAMRNSDQQKIQQLQQQLQQLQQISHQNQPESSSYFQTIGELPSSPISPPASPISPPSSPVNDNANSSP